MSRRWNHRRRDGRAACAHAGRRFTLTGRFRDYWCPSCGLRWSERDEVVPSIEARPDTPEESAA